MPRMLEDLKMRRNNKNHQLFETNLGLTNITVYVDMTDLLINMIRII